jgi:ABC-type Na+ efflux pump permease subunit
VIAKGVSILARLIDRDLLWLYVVAGALLGLLFGHAAVELFIRQELLP